MSEQQLYNKKINALLCRLNRSSNYVLREVAGEGILIDITNNRKIHLNPTGIYIWKLLDKYTPHQIAVEISKMTDAPLSKVFTDMEGFINKLLYSSAIVPEDGGNFSDINFNKFLFKSRKSRWPFTGVLELTHRCNFRCKHCYIPLQNRKNAVDKELSTEEWIKVLDRMSKFGTFLILLTGGEPILKKGFEQIYIHAKKLGFHITIYTNGFYFPEKLFPVLVRYPPAAVDISLYGTSNESYKTFTDVENGWSKVKNTIFSLKELGIELRAKAQLNHFTESEIRKIQKFTDSLNIPFRYRGTISPALENENTDVCQIMLDASEVVNFERSDINKFSKLQTLNPFLNELLETNPLPIKWPCGAGITSYIIQPSGEVTLCTQLREPKYNLGNNSLEEIWERFPMDIGKLINKPIIKEQVNKCQDCSLFSQCEICPAWIIRSKERTVRGYINTLCKLAEQRSSVFSALKVRSVSKKRR